MFHLGKYHFLSQPQSLNMYSTILFEQQHLEEKTTTNLFEIFLNQSIDLQKTSQIRGKEDNTEQRQVRKHFTPCRIRREKTFSNCVNI